VKTAAGYPERLCRGILIITPVYAGIYQFIIVATILTASGIAGLVMTLLMRARAFSPAAQLTLRSRHPAR
jgi:putative ABC transport system permease protein